ncbi:MAG TPA: MBL fold metallo-hydrolase [Humidesulfovibrio sp.]|uniref:MBL fold metallo-hydrolase n=1 Tax=Humidesulfovibrio sp. TaxID=2910988 RepID=UPI002B9D75A9|nr:MBL fold metallo-hydrolase [Humidesulfovibrio sp.]HWR04325.1 MBL fold metallo-hydrolase [Humidesulfovibrio sp.]
MRITSYSLGPLETNCYVLDHEGLALAVDPGGDPAEVLDFLRAEKLALKHILVTHLHFDHIYGCARLAEATGAPVLAPAGDAYLMDLELGRGGVYGFPVVEPFASQPVPLGQTEFIGLECHCLATPGHTPGSISYYFPQAGAAFVGDLIFYRSVGRTDFPGGSSAQLKESVQRHIFTLPDDTVLYSGHGLETSAADERTHNPFFLHDMF